MTESTTLAHSILDDEGIPRKGPFDFLSIGDRVTALQAKCQAIAAGNAVLRAQLQRIDVLLGTLRARAATCNHKAERAAVMMSRDADYLHGLYHATNDAANDLEKAIKGETT